MAKNALIIKGANFLTNKLTTVEFDYDEIPCTALSLSDSTKTVTELGDFTLTATKTPADTTDELIWTTSDSTVATISSGTVSVVGLGTATITATCGNQTATCVVTCSEVTMDVDYGFFKRQNISQYPNMFGYTESKRDLLICKTGVSWKELKNQSLDLSNHYYPVKIPENTGIVELIYGSDMRAGVIYFSWLKTNVAGYPQNYPDVAEQVSLDTTNSSAYNQAKTWQYEVPTGADGFAIVVTPVSSDYSESDTPEAIALAKGIVIKCKPATAST